MPLIPTGPNNYQPAPGWSRNPQLFETEINNAIMKMVPQSNGSPPSQYPSGAPPSSPGRAKLSDAQRLYNAQRTAAMMQGRPMPPMPGQGGVPGQGQGQPPSSIADQYQRQLNKANRANEQRYGDIVGGYEDLTEKALDRAEVAADQQYREESSRVSNDLVSRGLSASSLKGRKQFDAYERSQRLPLEVELQTGRDKLNFMERRNDQAPDLNQLLQLAQMEGQTNQFNQPGSLEQIVGQLGGLIDERIATANNPDVSRPINIPTRNLGMIGGIGNAFSGGGYQIPNINQMMGGGYGGGYQGAYGGGFGQRVGAMGGGQQQQGGGRSAAFWQGLQEREQAGNERRDRYGNIIQGRIEDANQRHMDQFPLTNQGMTPQGQKNEANQAHMDALGLTNQGVYPPRFPTQRPLFPRSVGSKGMFDGNPGYGNEMIGQPPAGGDGLAPGYGWDTVPRGFNPNLGAGGGGLFNTNNGVGFGPAMRSVAPGSPTTGGPPISPVPGLPSGRRTAPSAPWRNPNLTTATPMPVRG